eukprot:scaffold6662_cov112-Isochrysis_galbana.AAC.2
MLPLLSSSSGMARRAKAPAAPAPCVACMSCEAIASTSCAAGWSLRASTAAKTRAAPPGSLPPPPAALAALRGGRASRHAERGHVAMRRARQSLQPASSCTSAGDRAAAHAAPMRLPTMGDSATSVAAL